MTKQEHICWSTPCFHN